MHQKTVGIRELKAHLSRYMKDVKEGNEVLVSERGKAVARLLPMEAQSEHDRVGSFLKRLSAEGRIILPATRRKPSPPGKRKKVKGSPFSDAVKEMRR